MALSLKGKLKVTIPEPDEPAEPPSARKPRLVEVAPHLFMGNYPAACSLAALCGANISTIFNLCAKDCADQFAHKGFEYLDFNFADHGASDLEPQLSLVVAEIEKRVGQGRNVLVHCKQGKSRAPAVVLGYFIKVLRWSFEAGRDHLRARDPEVDPNCFFLMQLEVMAQSTKIGS